MHGSGRGGHHVRPGHTSNPRLTMTCTTKSHPYAGPPSIPLYNNRDVCMFFAHSACSHATARGSHAGTGVVTHGVTMCGVVTHGVTMCGVVTHGVTIRLGVVSCLPLVQSYATSRCSVMSTAIAVLCYV